NGHAQNIHAFPTRRSSDLAQQNSVTEAISQAVANSALDLNAKAIVTSTHSGFTARVVSKYRPKAPIVAVTPTEQVMRGLALCWGDRKSTRLNSSHVKISYA